MARICLVTKEYSGLTTSWEIGAYMRRLAETLVDQGNAVTILIVDEDFKADNVRVAGQVVASINGMARQYNLTFPRGAVRDAFLTHRFVSAQNYDEIHAPDRGALLYYSTMAMKQGLLLPRIVIHLLGSSEWRRKLVGGLPSPEQFECEAMERWQADHADHVVTDAFFLERNAPDQKNELQQNGRMNLPISCLAGVKAIEPAKLRELIFIGRQDCLNGFDLLIDELSRSRLPFEIDLLILGPFGHVSLEHSGAYAARRMRQFKGRIRFRPAFDLTQAISFAQSRSDAVCVLAAASGLNSIVAAECIAKSIPIVVRENSCDLGSLLSREDSSAISFASVENGLAEKIKEIWDKGLSSISTSGTKLGLTSVGEGAALQPSAPAADHAPLVSVCMTHYERPNFLRRALDHIMAQSYSQIEVIIVDDGSKTPAVQSALDHIERTDWRFPVKMIRAENKYLGAARNRAAKEASGRFLLFHDDDNIAEPNEVETFVRAALATNAAILTCLPWHFDRDDAVQASRALRYLPTGIGGPHSFFDNRFGDANAMIKRSAFHELGGFTELVGVGFEDYEFFLKAHIRGYSLVVVPELLFYYRHSAEGMLVNGDLMANRQRIFTALDNENAKLTGDLIACACAVFMRDQGIERVRTRLSTEPLKRMCLRLASGDPNSRKAIVRTARLACFLGRRDTALDLLVDAGGGKLVPGVPLRLALEANVERNRQRISHVLKTVRSVLRQFRPSASSSGKV